MDEPPIVVIYAHPAPRRSRVNHPLAEALAELPHVEVRELYKRYVDYDIDVVAEQRLLATAETVVLQFPVRWYSVPALMKLWLDEVLEHGWAYGPGGTALRGKSMLAVVSTGGHADAYGPDGVHGHPIGDFLLPLEQTALLCGMSWLPPVVLHDADRADPDAVALHIEHVARHLAPPPLPPETQDWPETEQTGEGA
ncbi:glutathione-regulated potassium-efflux system oxidoreductase KefF [Cupriavidus agavae]|uniref:Kef-type potassium/proton antiporter accessory protein (CPA2 family) n=1 Tax=Cupriavidus agavae TaxID=1001822 RepID=A0A4Q7RDI3_9BURK|nr:NAD(P)H-dependent oxidoreductase [Cupriavidus agavae]RZT29672.1 Kef-type potassium/proton antiporter accessory protein (CPA2 family) [Cupriavidus agavae]